MKYLEKAQLRANRTNQTILISIEDEFLKEGLKAKVKELNHFSDTSFNNEILSLNREAFLALVQIFFGDAEIGVYGKTQKELKKLFNDEGITAKAIFSKYLDGIIAGIGGSTVELGIKFSGNLVHVLPNIF